MLTHFFLYLAEKTEPKVESIIGIQRFYLKTKRYKITLTVNKLTYEFSVYFKLRLRANWMESDIVRLRSFQMARMDVRSVYAWMEKSIVMTHSAKRF